MKRLGAVCLAVGLLTLGGAGGTQAASARGPAFYGAGVLRLTMQDPTQALDPQFVTDPVDYELFRCCLLRTLYSYRPGTHPGPLLQPDLASGPPQVSDDRLTWTFHIRPGVRYAPPFQDDFVSSYDVVRAVRRLARVEVSGDTLEPYFRVIQGFDAYAQGRTSAIQGLATPDSRTIVVSLTQPAGDLAYRFSLPTTAPIPPSPANPRAPFGAATGHDFAWGQFLVSTGPYMYAGAQTVDYTKPPREQVASGGFEPGTSLVLVRNPSWSAATDPIRRPMPSRIEALLYVRDDLFGAAPLHQSGAFDLYSSGRVDTVLDALPPGTRPVYTSPPDSAWYATMNTAYPPFDDPDVRRAVALALAADRSRLARLMRPVVGAGRDAAHLIPDDLERELLASFAPRLSPARDLMRRSRYGGPDGRCRSPVCAKVPAVYAWGDSSLAAVRDRIAADLRALGIDLAFTTGDPTEGGRPKATAVGAFDFPVYVAAPYPDPSTFLLPAFAGSAIVKASNGGGQTGAGGLNISLLGATSAELAGLGYPVRRTPSVDDRLQQCQSAVGLAETQCWAYADTYLTDVQAPWVPIAFGATALALSGRVRSPVSADPLTGLPALEALRPQGGVAPLSGIAHPHARCLPPPIPIGIYHKTITLADLRSPSEPAFVRHETPDGRKFNEDFIPGRWRLIVSAADRNCVYGSTGVQYQDGGVHYTDAHPFTVLRQNVIELHGSGESVGTYRVVPLGNRAYQMVKIRDPGGEITRAEVEVTNPWLTGP